MSYLAGMTRGPAPRVRWSSRSSGDATPPMGRRSPPVTEPTPPLDASRSGSHLVLLALAAQLALLATLPQSPAAGTATAPRDSAATADVSAPLAAAAPTQQDAGHEARPTRRVLLLFDPAKQLPAVALIDQIVRRRLEADSSWRVELFEEHLGIDDVQDGATNQLTFAYLRQKYALRRIDLVIGAALPHAVVEKLSA